MESGKKLNGDFGGHTEVGKIDRLIVHHAKNAFVSQAHLRAHWKEFGYSACPDFDNACGEFERFTSLLSESNAEILYLPHDDRAGIDSIYVRDSVIITNRGAILCNMGKEIRRKEPILAAEFLSDCKIPILGRITEPGRLEGGDVIWLDEQTLVVGRGYRTNDDGIRQLRALTEDFVGEMVVVPLPHWDGPQGVLHLMSLMSPIDVDLAVVFARLLPVQFREWLISRGMTLLEISDSEFETMGCNILAIAPKKCIIISGNPNTKRLLEQENVEVMEYNGAEISRKGAGGPTCLTRPIHRQRLYADH